MARFFALFLLISSFLLAGCVIKEPVADGATETSSKAGPTQRATQDSAAASNPEAASEPSNPAVTSGAGTGAQDSPSTNIRADSQGHSHDLIKVEPGSTFLAEREVTLKTLPAVIKAIGKLDSHGGDRFNDAFAKSTVDQVRELKEGERIRGSLHTDTKNGHEEVLLALIRGKGDKVLVRIQLASQEATDAARKLLNEA
ncbi:MAG: hypothetical protein MUC92_04780 [Fimbriimonadaceae bacterium]|jgi:hypothetical protein|nr:hypothetical protein [Fimbriimonadaceae bacterium]